MDPLIVTQAINVLYAVSTLAVLALAAGVMLPASVVAVIGQIAYLGECLDALYRQGLAEHRNDRFGLPICKVESYRHMLLKDLHLAASARELAGWLSAEDPTTWESLSAAEAALTPLPLSFRNYVPLREI